MIEQLTSLLSRVEAEYADLRYEIKRETSITFQGKELTQIGSSTTDGFVLRVLIKGGLSSIAFTKASHAEQAIRTARENALLLAGHLDEPVRFAPAEAVRETFLPGLDEDPRKVSTEEKLSLVRHYNNLVHAHEKIAHTVTDYSETSREKYFVSTEGSAVREDLVTTRLSGLITSREGSLIQTIRVGLGGSQGFACLRNQEEEFEKKTAVVLDLLKARPVEGGAYSVILNPSLAGVFTHEAFGHFSEADLIEDSPTLREKMRLGAALGNEAVSITDDPTLPGQLGFYRFDDEGVPARPVALMRKGVLTGRLHSRRTAAAFGEPLSGHCVAEDSRYAPIIRMGNIFIEPGPFSFDQMLSRLGDGLYLLNAMGGQTSGENFTFGAQYGYVVRDGRVQEMVRDINLSGNLYRTLERIVAVGKDLTLSRVGGCGKGQLNIRSSNGGPHILVEDVVIGGR
jgi:TldD protein